MMDSTFVETTESPLCYHVQVVQIILNQCCYRFRDVTQYVVLCTVSYNNKIKQTFRLYCLYFKFYTICPNSKKAISLLIYLHNKMSFEICFSN
ncbi:unnamed protein product [Paramecium octaurelia]|uniref:Uncharacterized protein n=1 Tax=Paramecium octaurelia TaxID=43137 RepID=A0A8S1TSV7_PAROT|nr:unnamed protein product [Paramecium octaurelia]